MGLQVIATYQYRKLCLAFSIYHLTYHVSLNLLNKCLGNLPKGCNLFLLPLKILNKTNAPQIQTKNKKLATDVGSHAVAYHLFSVAVAMGHLVTPMAQVFLAYFYFLLLSFWNIFVLLGKKREGALN